MVTGRGGGVRRAAAASENTQFVFAIDGTPAPRPAFEIRGVVGRGANVFDETTQCERIFAR
eukprot:1776569-Lingulodinium_polyedra.AAC.1